MEDEGVDGVMADLDLLFEQVAALRALAADPVRAADPGCAYDFSITWGAMVAGRLPRLSYYQRRGELSEAEGRRYRELLAQLAAAEDLVTRFGLARPELR